MYLEKFLVFGQSLWMETKALATMPPTHIGFGLCIRACPFITLFDACHILWTMHAKVLKFHIWNPDEKMSDPYFFLLSDKLYFLSYAPETKSEWSLKKLFETWWSDRGWWVNYLINFWIN